MNALRTWLDNRSTEDDLRIVLWICLIGTMILLGVIWHDLSRALAPQPHCGCLGGTGTGASSPQADSSDLSG